MTIYTTTTEELDEIDGSPAKSELMPLLACPSCNLSKEKFKEHQENMPHITKWDFYKPSLLKDEIFGRWFVQCANCSFTVTWMEDEKTTIELWNEINRAS